MSSFQQFCDFMDERFKPLEGLVAIDCKEDEELPNTIELYSIKATQMRGGAGSKALALLCEAADATGFDLFLGVKNEYMKRHMDGDPTEDDLVRWYTRYGFVPVDRVGGILSMVRKA